MRDNFGDGESILAHATNVFQKEKFIYYVPLQNFCINLQQRRVPR